MRNRRTALALLGAALLTLGGVSATAALAAEPTCEPTVLDGPRKTAGDVSVVVTVTVNCPGSGLPLVVATGAVDPGAHPEFADPEQARAQATAVREYLDAQSVSETAPVDLSRILYHPDLEDGWSTRTVMAYRVSFHVALDQLGIPWVV